MSPYKVELPTTPGYISPFAEGGSSPFVIEAVNDVIDEEKQTRSLTLRIRHPGVIWTGSDAFLTPSSLYIYLFEH